MINVAIVGAGGIARQHVASFRQIDNARIVAIVDVVPEKAEAMAATCGAKAYTDLAQCLDQVEMVSVLTPPSVRRPLAVQAIEAGKHVLCEKPLAITIEDATAIVTAARAAGVKLMTGFNHRFRPGFARLHEIVQSGELGSVVNFWSQRLGGGAGVGGRAVRYNWRTDPELLCGMTVESLSHDIDMMRWVTGEEPTDVRANVRATVPDLPAFDNNANAVFSLSGGGTAVIHSSWASYVGRNSRGVLGSDGSAYVEGPNLWDLTNFRWRTRDMKYESINVINDPLDPNCYALENSYFIGCIERDETPSPSGEDGLKVLSISHAILESNREGRAVPIM